MKLLMSKFAKVIIIIFVSVICKMYHHIFKFSNISLLILYVVQCCEEYFDLFSTKKEDIKEKVNH